MEKSVKLTNQKVKALYMNLNNVSKLQNIPFKFAIIQNMAMLKPSYEEIIAEESKMFKENVKLDNNGDGVIRQDIIDEYKAAKTPMPVSLPYNFFEYEEGVTFKDFDKKIKEFYTKEYDGEFKLTQEKLSRNIKIKDKDGAFKEHSIKDIIEDPNHSLNADMIGYLLEYEILVN